MVTNLQEEIIVTGENWRDFGLYLDNIKEFRKVFEEILNIYNSNENSVVVCTIMSEKLSELKKIIESFEKILKSDNGRLFEKIFKRVNQVYSNLEFYVNLARNSLQLLEEIKSDILNCNDSSICNGKLKELIEDLENLKNFLKDYSNIVKILLKNLEIVRDKYREPENTSLSYLINSLKLFKDELEKFPIDKWIVYIEELKKINVVNLSNEERQKVAEHLEETKRKLEDLFRKLNSNELHFGVDLFKRIFIEGLTDFYSYLDRLLKKEKIKIKVLPKERKLGEILKNIKESSKSKSNLKEKIKLEEKEVGIKEAIEIVKKQLEEMKNVIESLESLKREVNEKINNVYRGIESLINNLEENNLDRQNLEGFKRKTEELKVLLDYLESEINSLEKNLEENLFKNAENIIKDFEKIKKATITSENYIKKTLEEFGKVNNLLEERYRDLAKKLYKYVLDWIKSNNGKVELYFFLPVEFFNKEKLKDVINKGIQNSHSFLVDLVYRNFFNFGILIHHLRQIGISDEKEIDSILDNFYNLLPNKLRYSGSSLDKLKNSLIKVLNSFTDNKDYKVIPNLRENESRLLLYYLIEIAKQENQNNEIPLDVGVDRNRGIISFYIFEAGNLEVKNEELFYSFNKDLESKFKYLIKILKNLDKVLKDNNINSFEDLKNKRTNIVNYINNNIQEEKIKRILTKFVEIVANS